MPLETSLDHLAFSPDSGQLLTLTCNKLLTVWQLHQGERPCLSHQPGRNIDHGHWDAEGQRMLTINEAGAAITNLETGQMVTPPLAHGGPLHAVAVQGRKIITVAKRGTVSIWELPDDRPPRKGTAASQPDPRPLTELLAFAQVLAAGRINDRQQWEAFEPIQLRSAWENWQNAR